jgi:hypothetical protein
MRRGVAIEIDAGENVRDIVERRLVRGDGTRAVRRKSRCRRTMRMA